MPAIMMADPGHIRQPMGAPQQGMGGPQNMGGPQGVGGPPVDHIRRLQDLETLKQIISQWNANRLDLFELSLPNEELEFTGVMRFYYQAQDLGSGQKVATKCIRVSSTATTKAIIETLIEKFRPDMKMLEVPEYALYEIHESGERRLGLDEKPLLVQLNWHKDDREGRFLLRRIDEASHMPQPTQEDSSFKRKLSKREKKALKKQEKKEKVNKKENADESMADKLYTELPDTSFTRSISNPEAVMRRRRQQKLEKKLQQFRSKDGGPDTGGTLKIYGESLRKDVPYKTLLLSVRDTAISVVGEMLEKYGVSKSEVGNYCLVQSNLTMPDDGGEGQVVGGGTTREYILDDEECPLNILMQHQANRGGAVTFHVRRRPPDGSGPRRRKKKVVDQPSVGPQLPFLVELTPEGGDSRVFQLQPDRFTEVGSEVGPGGVQLPGLLPRHCVLAHTEGVVTVTPCSPQAEVGVNNQRLGVETTILQHGSTVRFGRSVWRFIDPNTEVGPRGAGPGSSSTLPGPNHGGSTATLSELQHGLQTPGMRSSTANYVTQQPPPSRGKDAILPAVLEFREDTEDTFFNALTLVLDPAAVNFKLAPTYTIYMATRFRASTHYRPELVPEERAVRLTDMLNRVADKMLGVIQSPPGNGHAPSLSFWMANSSELLHFLKSDRHITAFSLQAQDMLADAVHIAFKQLVVSLQSELELVLPALLSDQEEGEQTTAGIISVFSSAMGLLRKCRVNAALTIQLFSQLFHFVNMWTFNQLVADIPQGQERPNLCTHKWGMRLKRRLAKVEIWAEKQGLELAADCHLARITQAAHLLQARKGTAEDIASLSSTCFKLNSMQLECLLSRYQPAENEAPINKELIETIVRVAQNTVDELTRNEGRQVRLEEDFVLQLPFLLPEDNYSCDIVRGVPGGLAEFLGPLQKAGFCVMTPQPTSSGYWTIYMDTPPPITPVPRSPSEMSQVTNNGGDLYDLHHQHMGPHGGPINGGMNGGPHMNGSGPPHHSKGGPPTQEPEVATIRLSKTNGMGLSIVAAKGVGKEKLGIYIKAVVEGGAAWQDGRLQAGDQLLKVDGQSLVGITQEKAAEVMKGTGMVVTLEVAKQGAFYHGLATLLSQPSPVMGGRPFNGGDQGYGTGPKRMSERDLRGPPPNGGPMMGSSERDLRGPPNGGPMIGMSDRDIRGPPHNGGPMIGSSERDLRGPPHNGGPMLGSSERDLRGPPPNGGPMMGSSERDLRGSYPPGGPIMGSSERDLRGPPPNGGQMMGPQPPVLPGRIPQSKSTPSLAPSPGESQHNYQNQEWLHHQVAPRGPPVGPKSNSTLNLGPRPNIEHEHGFYQNLVPPGPPSHQGGGPPPFHRQRFGSQTSLAGGPQGVQPPGRDRPMSAHYPMSGGPPRYPGPGGPHGPKHQGAPPLTNNNGPEKPQRQFSYELEGSGAGQPRQGPPSRTEDGPKISQQNRLEDGMGPKISQQNRVRFQDPQSQEEDSSLSQLRPQEVEQEFRRRVEEYQEDSEDDENSKVSTIKRNGTIPSDEESRRKMDERRTELEQERQLQETLTRRRIHPESNSSTPPPLPNSPPPAEDPPVVLPNTGTQRLDMLLGNNSGTLNRPSKPPKSETPTKRVSFMPPEQNPVSKFEYDEQQQEDEESEVEEQEVDEESGRIDQDKLDQLNANEDPNAFISEAEQLLNSATMGMSRLDFNIPSHTGHTPSVIGTQEIYRDPRSRRIAAENEKKLSQEKPPDGAKLSFKEKMKLFAQEVGENTPRDKAKISKAQREIED